MENFNWGPILYNYSVILCLTIFPTIFPQFLLEIMALLRKQHIMPVYCFSYQLQDIVNFLS
jgi:hypothetical protein